MGVTCSLLGHDYGDADVERERTERGEEVVRTAKRVERCRNCGHTRTISENKEITSLEAAAGVVREPDGTVVATTEADGGLVVEDGEETADAPDQSDGEDDAASIDGIDRIHTDEPRAEPSRAPGEWPAESDEPVTTAETPQQESSGLSSSGSLTAGGADTGRWPDETETARLSDTAENRTEPVAESGSVRTGRPGDSFTCASCGFSAAVVDSPLRAGDICPDCGHGYLAWETRKG